MKLYKYSTNSIRHKCSTNHALISLKENIRKNLDEGKVKCGIFVDLRKVFDTVDHNILLTKLERYRIRGVANDWSKYFLYDGRQFASISGFNSNRAILKHGIPQGSVPKPVLFLIYVNDLNHPIKYSKV